MWEVAGTRVSAALAPHSAVAVLGDDPAATGAVALGLARLHARTRRVYLLDLLGDGQGIVSREDAELHPGVSDMVHYGVSLDRAAHPHSGRANIYVVGGGAESPLTVEILTSRWWEVIAEQVRRAQGLLLVAAPARVPAMGQMVMHLDGIVLVGEAVSPNPAAALLAEVRSDSALHTPTGGAAISPFAPRGAAPSRARLAILTVVVLALGAGAVFTAPTWRPLLAGFIDARSTREPAPPLDSAVTLPPPVVAAPVANEASFSVELLLTASGTEAVDYVARRGDSLPAMTFSTVLVGADTVPAYRLVSGAFPDSASAEEYLASLRGDGRLTTGAGAVARTPFALLLDSASSDAIAQVRVAAYRGRGIPAYLLRDSSLVWRVYAGAFSTEGDARLLKQQLDSLNIQSALVMRAGSTP